MYGLRCCIELKFACKAETADRTAVCLGGWLSRRSLCDLIETESGCGTAARKYSIVSRRFAFDSLVVKVVRDVCAELGEVLWAEAAAHVYEDVDVCTN